MFLFCIAATIKLVNESNWLTIKTERKGKISLQCEADNGLSPGPISHRVNIEVVGKQLLNRYF